MLISNTFLPFEYVHGEMKCFQEIVTENNYRLLSKKLTLEYRCGAVQRWTTFSAFIFKQRLNSFLIPEIVKSTKSYSSYYRNTIKQKLTTCHSLNGRSKPFSIDLISSLFIDKFLSVYLRNLYPETKWYRSFGSFHFFFFETVFSHEKLL